MGFRSGVRALFGRDAPKAAVRMVDRRIAQFDIGVDDLPWLSNVSAQGPRVTREQALAVPAVLKGRNMLAGAISPLPIRTVDADLRPVRVSLFEQIDPNIANSVTMAMTVEDLFLEAIAWWQVLARDSARYPTSCQRVEPHNVTFQMPASWPLNRLPSGYYPGSHVFILNTLTAVPASDIIRFDSPNPPLLVAAARPIRRALKHEDAADNYADNPQAREYFTPSEDADPDDENEDEDGRNAVTKFLDTWIVSRRLRTTGFVPASLKLEQIQQPSPADLQLVQVGDKDTRDLANAMGLDPEDLGVSTTSRTYQNAVDRRQDKINEFSGPYIAAIAGRLSMGDITRRGQSVYLDLREYLRANPLDEATVHQTYYDMGTETDDEIRAEVHRRPPLTPQQRQQMRPAPVAPRKPEHANWADTPGGGATVTALRPRVAAAHAGELVGPAATFSAGEGGGPGLVFDVSGIPRSFEVNEAKRTITGLAAPWDKVGRSGGRRWKFAPNALQYDAGKVSRNKLLNDHDQSQSVARLEKTWSDERGQWARFRVARGPAGDRALAEAADGIKDGLSVGIGYEGADHGIVFGTDPAGEGDVLYVVSAPWRETSLVAIPAFDDARVSAVSMSADPINQGAPMKCTLCGLEHAAGIACPQAPPTAPQIVIDTTPITAAINAGFAAAANATAMGASQIDPLVGLEDRVTAATNAALVQFAADNPGPTVVNPMRPGEQAQVTEAPLYRFDGGKAQRCFTADLIKVMEGDADTKAVVEKYMAEEMAAQFANITPANVAPFNPVPTRPELYVPNLDFPRPLGDQVTMGPLDNLIAFIVPKFSSASGLVGDHVTGTEPTQGAFAATSQTITPKGLSGRVDLDREIIDSGGNPQADQIIYAEMARAYTEQLETRIVDMFQALSLSDTAIIGMDSDLDTALGDFFSGFQFLRGGDRYDSWALEQGLYKGITGAKDQIGRPLFPRIGVQNANGTVSSDLTRVVVGSKTGRPAWALGSGNGGPDRSFIWAKSNTYQWSSAPRRFTFDQVNVSAVGIAIWGYSAEAVTRASDIYQMSYSQA